MNNRRWITGWELFERLNISHHELVDIVLNGELQPYDSDSHEAINVAEEKQYIKEQPNCEMGFVNTLNDMVSGMLFKLSDVGAWEIEHSQTQQQHEPPRGREQQRRKTPEQNKAINFFTRKGKFWEIGYEDETGTVSNLDGISYITILLERPKKSILCRELYYALSKHRPDNLITEGAAIGEGLNIGSHNKQSISDPKAKDEYARRYQRLQNGLEKAESELERQEIEEEMEKILSSLKAGVFSNEHMKKFQSNIKKRLDVAYDELRKCGLKKLSQHLQENINPDKSYGLSYTGNIAWNITQ